MLKTWPQLSKCLCVWVCARHCIMNFLLFHLNLTTWSARSSEHVCTCAHGCMYACMHSHMHIPRVRMIKLRMMIEVTPLWGDSPCPGSKDKPQQDGRMGKFIFWIKPHSRQRRSKGSNKPCAYQDPGNPQRVRQNCVWVYPVEVQVSSRLPQGRGYGCSRFGCWHKPSWRRSPLSPP